MDTIKRRLRVGGEAADWWALLHSDEVAREDRERFVEWLRESHVHVTEMLRVMQVHGALNEFDEWELLPQEDREVGADVIALAGSLHEMKEKRSLLRSWFPAALAAGVAILAAVGLWVLPALNGQVIATEQGERREVVLADGSVVQVDPQTYLKVQFGDEFRRVVLTEGRAVFRVAKHPSRPFLVESHGALVRAVGTVFGVERRSRDLLVVTVIEGKVAVQPTSAQPSKLLTVDQQIVIEGARSAAAVQQVDGEHALAWAQGKLIFENETVAAIAAQFNRYNRVQLRINDVNLAARRVSGVFDAAYPEEFVAFIRGATPVDVERVEGRTISLSSRSGP